MSKNYRKQEIEPKRLIRDRMTVKTKLSRVKGTKRCKKGLRDMENRVRSAYINKIKRERENKKRKKAFFKLVSVYIWVKQRGK